MLFNALFVAVLTIVCYTPLHQQDKKAFSSFSLPGQGTTPIVKFNYVAEELLNPIFNEKHPDYPAFSKLRKPIRQGNFHVLVESALQKIVAPQKPNSDGEAMLEGLQIWDGERVELEYSKYASHYLNKVHDLDDGSVLNRDDILACHSEKQNLWYDVEFHLEHELMFIILTAMVYEGEIEISWSGSKEITASNITTVTGLKPEEYFTFRHIKKPKGVPTKDIKTLFRALDLPDMTAQLDRPETVQKIIAEAQKRVDIVAKEAGKLRDGISCRGIPLLTDAKLEKYQNELDQLRNLLDRIIDFDTYGKLKNFSLSAKEIEEAFEAWPLIEKIKDLKSRADEFGNYAGYLERAQMYVHEEAEQKLYEDIEDAIDNLPVKLKGDSTELKKYEATLKELKDRYSQYYRKNFHKYRLSPDEAQRKQRLVNSDKKHICDILTDAAYLSGASYSQWREQLQKLKKQQKDITEADLERSPYHEFDPKEYVGKNIFSVGELEDQLEDIYADLLQKAKNVFEDPSAQKNKDLLSDEDQALIERFGDGNVDLDEGKAKRIRDGINTVVSSIDRIEISKDDLKKHFSQPLNPKEAKEVFNHLIDEQCKGKKHEDIRIVFTSED